MHLGERTIRSTRVYDGRLVALRVDEVELPSGKTAVREIVEHRGAVAIIPLLPSGDVVLVRQYRAPAGRRLLEIPAGTIEPGEPVAACASRELAEEVGLRAERWQPLGAILPSPGFLTEVVHLFLAEDLSPHPVDAEEEEMEVVAVPLDEAVDLVTRGEICDAKSVAGILLASRYLESSR
ncbi:MAG TPA: NUDIX hydrolase [bacterium]|jgi:ADP-ribose pyrophosphatase|nr:NUDIX hydrolase [bacterium]